MRSSWHWHLVSILAFVLVPQNSAPAQKLYLLVAADTSKAGGIALSTGPDVGFMFDTFFANVPGRQLVLYGMEPFEATDGSRGVAWRGPDVRDDLGNMKQKLLGAIDNCPAGSEDTVVFFYSGHGAHDNQGHYLLMPDQRSTLSRKTILERIQRKNPRLAVVITDSCSTQVDRGLLGPRPSIEPPDAVSPLFDELFFRAEGVADFNSCTEGQFAAGPEGGGLMVLAMAYLANKPRFQPPKNRGIDVEPTGPAGADRPSIPPVDFHRAIGGRFGWSEHGVFPNFNPDLPSFGVLWEDRERRLSWPEFAKRVKAKTAELYQSLPESAKSYRGKYQPTQTVQFYSLPKKKAGPPQQRVLHIEPGDVIVSVNGRPIHNMGTFWHAVKGSPVKMNFAVIDRRTGNTVFFETRLRSGPGSRFGVVVEESPGQGVRILTVRPDSPGARARR